MPKLYAAAGQRILDSYRHSSDAALHHFDWHKAEVYLERASDLGDEGDRTMGALALSRGYSALERLGGGMYSRAAAARLRKYARDQFELAAKRMPDSPDPRLALARFYVYSQPDVNKAMREFDQAERLGATIGQREAQQQADAFRAEDARKAKVRRVRRWR